MSLPVGEAYIETFILRKKEWQNYYEYFIYATRRRENYKKYRKYIIFLVYKKDLKIVYSKLCYTLAGITWKFEGKCEDKAETCLHFK